MRSRIVMTLIALVLFLTVTGSVFSQDPAPQLAEDDPIEQLRLTPEQRQRIRLLFEENKNERQIINRRLREANVALDQALDADPLDDNVIEQRIKELAAAQSVQLRMRIQTELRIRRELRPEQLAVLRSLRLQIRDVMNVQRPRNRLNQQRSRESLRPNQRNSVAPTLPHRNIRQP